MAIPWGAIVTGGASILGGLISRSSANSDAAMNAAISEHMFNLQKEENIRQEQVNAGWQSVLVRRNEDLQREAMLRSEMLQREFAQSGIKWRAQDAKEAGLHPLFALGGGGAAFSPMAMVGSGGSNIASGGASATPAFRDRRGTGIGSELGKMGQDLARAIFAQENAEERAARAAALELTAAQTAKDRAIASYYENEAQRVKADVITSPMPTERPILFRELPPHVPGGSNVSGPRGGKNVAPFGISQPKADEPISAAPQEYERTAGVHPALRLHTMATDGRKRLQMYLPYSDEGPWEAWGELGITEKLWFINYNVQKFGMGWLRDFMSITPRSSPGATGEW